MTEPAIVAETPATFTVVVPCYNDGEWLPRAIESAFAQSRAPDAVLVIDDGSTDETAALCADFEARHPTFRYHRQDNAGVSAARNAGIEHNRSAFITFLDADDELRPDALAIYEKTVTSHPEARWLIGSSEWERDGRVKHRTPKLPDTRLKRFQTFMDKTLHLGNISNMCFHASLFEALRFPTAHRFGEDLVVFAILLTQTDPLVLDEVTALQHRREDSLRSQATFDEHQDSTVPTTVFEHPLLPGAYAQYAATYWARHSRSIMKRAYKERRYAEAIHWYQEMTKANPLAALHPKWTWRYINARMRMEKR